MFRITLWCILRLITLYYHIYITWHIMHFITLLCSALPFTLPIQHDISTPRTFYFAHGILQLWFMDTYENITWLHCYCTAFLIHIGGVVLFQQNTRTGLLSSFIIQQMVDQCGGAIDPAVEFYGCIENTTQLPAVWYSYITYKTIHYKDSMILLYCQVCHGAQRHLSSS